jgi:antitoxin component YwqK of YwqJK toxin-antitoxin module
MKAINFTITGGMIKLVLLLMLLLASCKNDVLEEQKKYHKNGHLKSVEYFNEKGKQEGENKYYLENGLLNYSNTFNNGNLIKTQYFYDNGKLHYSSEKKDNDTINSISYFKNGNIKSKGSLINDKKVGWWKTYYPGGNLKEEYEFLIINNKEYANQIKIYDSKGKIKDSESSFFEIKLSDTLQIVKNAGSLKYYSVSSKNSERHLYVIIDNEYEGGEVRKDTFFIGSNENNRFGIYAYKSGLLKVKGMILDRELYERERGKNSFELEFKDHHKYFEKQVYVK